MRMLTGCANLWAGKKAGRWGRLRFVAQHPICPNGPVSTERYILWQSATVHDKGHAFACSKPLAPCTCKGDNGVS